MLEIRLRSASLHTQNSTVRIRYFYFVLIHVSFSPLESFSSLWCYGFCGGFRGVVEC